MDQYLDIISASDAWLIADEDEDAEHDARVTERELRPTNSARRVKALVEQVTGTSLCLPDILLLTAHMLKIGTLRYHNTRSARAS